MNAAHAKATRLIRNFAGVVRRTELGQNKGRNADATADSARYGYERSLAAVVAIEDAEGVEAAAKLSDRLTLVRQRAQAVGLISPSDIVDVEARVFG